MAQLSIKEVEDYIKVQMARERSLEYLGDFKHEDKNYYFLVTIEEGDFTRFNSNHTSVEFIEILLGRAFVQIRMHEDIIEQAQKYSLKNIKRALKFLSDYDRDLKGGGVGQDRESFEELSLKIIYLD